MVGRAGVEPASLGLQPSASTVVATAPIVVDLAGSAPASYEMLIQFYECVLFALRQGPSSGQR